MAEIYLGRIVAAGMTQDGQLAAMYRVSSRSFPNRQAVIGKEGVSIVPKPGFESDIFKNPYIAYNCARIINKEIAVLSNGSHTDPIVEKLLSGMSIRDALIYSLAVMDYEKDSYDTPRIAVVVRKGEKNGWLGTIRRDGLDVRSFPLEKGKCVFVSTYEKNVPNGHNVTDFAASGAEAGCAYVLGQGEFASFTNPVTAVCAFETKSGFDLAAQDAPAK